MKTTHYKIEIGFGVGLTKSGEAICDYKAEARLSRIRSRASNLFDGCTLVPTVGNWTNSVGTIFTEPGRTLIVYIPAVTVPSGTVPAPDSMAVVRGLIGYIKDQLDQEAVALCITPVDFQIV